MNSTTTTSAERREFLVFHVRETGQSYRVAAGPGVTVATATPDGETVADQAAARIRLPEQVFLGLLLGSTSLAEALLAPELVAEGDLAAFVRFHRLFEIRADRKVKKP